MSNQTPGLTPGSQPDPAAVILSVVRGNPTDTELAALVTVLATRAGAAAATSSAGQPTPARAPRSGWSDRSRLLRGNFSPGADAWRRSALPR